MSREEKMTITWTRYVTRPANEQDVAEQDDWLRKHPGGHSVPYILGEEIEVEESVELPGKYEVCHRCEGRGKHVNPSIDGHGITASEWHDEWSEEEREHYMEGWYDVTCHECKGKRVVLEVDEDMCDKQLFKEYCEHQEHVSRMEYEDRMTRWAEDGYRGSPHDY